MNIIRRLSMGFGALERGRWGGIFVSTGMMENARAVKPYHIMSPREYLKENCSSRYILNPVLPTLTFTCGLKYKGRVRRRCKDCYFVVRDERLYVMCKTHPRHKQALIKSPEKKTWILSHVCQSPQRPW